MNLDGRMALFVFLARSGSKPLALAVAGGTLLFLFHPLWGGPKTGAPNAVKKKTAESQTAEWLLEDSLLFRKSTLGTITGMASSPLGPDSQPAIVVAGNYGAACYSDKGELRSAVKYERKGFQMAPVDLKGDGNYAFMNRGGDGQQVGLFDSEGRMAWRHGLGLEPVPNDMAAGDLDGDGELEFVVGMSGEGGIRLLDARGKEKWRQPDVNVWHVEILDWDGDGKNEIVHSNASGQVGIRDAAGKLIREMRYNAYVGYFTLCRWPDAAGSWFVLNNNKKEGIQLLDFQGNVITRFIAPVKGQRVFAAPVRLAAETKPYFALLICDRIPDHDTRLYLYDPDGEIIFEKRFLTSQASLLTVPNETPGTEKLLVGENDGAVWQFRLKPAGPAKRN